jgi:hypothetical protein
VGVEGLGALEFKWTRHDCCRAAKRLFRSWILS